MLLYDSAVSGNSYKVRLLLAHLGLRYERRETSVNDRSNRDKILGPLNPALRVPTIVLDDGRPLAESERDSVVLRTDRNFQRTFLWPGAISQDREECQFVFWSVRNPLL